MRSVQLVAPHTLEPRDMEMARDPGPGEVLVKVRAVGICGSDLHWYLEGGVTGHRPAHPEILGHEPAGVIEAVGSGVHHLRAGQRVAMEPNITCGECEYCRAGRHNHCVHSRFMGSAQLPGFFREYATLPAHNAVPVPDRMSFSEATVIEPLSVILHMLDVARVRLGDTVAVLGAGPIGFLTAAAARTAGASRIFMTDRLPHRLKIASDAGLGTTIDIGRQSAVEVVMDHTLGRGVDMVFDCAASDDTLDLAVRLARRCGRLVLIGIPGTQYARFQLFAAMLKELNIQTIMRSNQNAEAAIAMLEARRIPLGIITHHFPLEQTPRAFDTLASYADGIGKAIIEIP